MSGVRSGPGGMAEIPRDQIEQANSDIVAVIGRYLPLKKAGKNWVACCPFHDERSPSFSVSAQKGFFYCYGCRESGDAVGFLMKHLGISFREAVESINGRIDLVQPETAASRPRTPRAVRCDLPGHAESPDRAARFVGMSTPAQQHPYLLRNNVAPCGEVLTLKGALIVPILNSLGEQVNAAAITASGTTYAAGSPSFGSTAIIEPSAEFDGKTIICADYAHAWRIWWAQRGSSRVLCAMSSENMAWSLAHTRDRFTHIGCDPSEADWYAMEYGLGIIAVPITPYGRRDHIDRRAVLRD